MAGKQDRPRRLADLELAAVVGGADTGGMPPGFAGGATFSPDQINTLQTGILAPMPPDQRDAMQAAFNDAADSVAGAMDRIQEILTQTLPGIVNLQLDVIAITLPSLSGRRAGGERPGRLDAQPDGQAFL